MKIEPYYKIEISAEDSIHKKALDCFLVLKLYYFLFLRSEAIRTRHREQKIQGKNFEIKIRYNSEDIKKSLKRLSSKKIIYFSKECEFWRINNLYSGSSVLEAKRYLANIFERYTNLPIYYSDHEKITYTYEYED